jgi:hypothetical protein
MQKEKKQTDKAMKRPPNGKLEAYANKRIQKVKPKCLECKKEIQKSRDAFNYDGMRRDVYYCRNCYFKKL